MKAGGSATSSTMCAPARRRARWLNAPSSDLKEASPLHLKRLPQTVADRLGAPTIRQAAPYLNKVRQFYCRPMTYHRLCPQRCWRCTRRLLGMAADMPRTGVWAPGTKSWRMPLPRSSRKHAGATVPT